MPVSHSMWIESWGAVQIGVSRNWTQPVLLAGIHLHVEREIVRIVIGKRVGHGDTHAGDVAADVSRSASVWFDPHPSLVGEEIGDEAPQADDRKQDGQDHIRRREVIGARGRDSGRERGWVLLGRLRVGPGQDARDDECHEPTGEATRDMT